MWVEKKWVNSVSANDQHTPTSEQRNEHYFVTNCDLKSQISSKKNNHQSQSNQLGESLLTRLQWSGMFVVSTRLCEWLSRANKFMPQHNFVTLPCAAVKCKAEWRSQLRALECETTQNPKPLNYWNTNTREAKSLCKSDIWSKNVQAAQACDSSDCSYSVRSEIISH